MSGENKKTEPVSGLAAGMAVVVIIVWMAGLAWLFFNTDATDATWARWLTVLTALEAVAFAAAGVLFGTTVQRQRVADAQDVAKQAEERAEANANDAANGRKLAERLKGRASAQPAGASGIERTSVGASADGTDDLLELAQHLFPD